MKRIHFALLIADFESYVLLQEIIHVHFFVEGVVADWKLIKQSSLLVFTRFKFELFQILNILGQTLMEVLFAHERRNPSYDHSEQLPGFYLNFYLVLDGDVGTFIIYKRIQFIVFFAHF